MRQSELRWFRHMLIHRISNEDERREILKSSSTSIDLKELILDVHQKDKERLMAWIYIAVNLDKVVSIEEIKMAEQLTKLLKVSKPLNIDESYQVISQSITESEERKQAWNDLRELAEELMGPVSPFFIFMWQFILVRLVFRIIRIGIRFYRNRFRSSFFKR